MAPSPKKEIYWLQIQMICIFTFKKSLGYLLRFSRLVVSDSLPTRLLCHGISQVRLLECVAISYSRGSSWTRDGIHVSCISRWILYHWATRECQWLMLGYVRLFFCFVSWGDLSSLTREWTPGYSSERPSPTHWPREFPGQVYFARIRENFQVGHFLSELGSKA